MTPKEKLYREGLKIIATAYHPIDYQQAAKVYLEKADALPDQICGTCFYRAPDQLGANYCELNGDDCVFSDFCSHWEGVK